MIEKSRDLTLIICRSHQKIPPYSSADLIKGFHIPHLKISSRDSYPVASRTGTIALVSARLKYPLEYPGYGGELGYSRYQMLPKPDTRDADLLQTALYISGAAKRSSQT